MRVWAFSLALVLFAISSAQAADMRVAPTRLFFAPNQRVQDITIGNPGQQPLLVELQAFHWTDQPPSAAEDVVISPPIAQIAGGDTAVVRVGFRGSPTAACETTYRLWVTEVPQETVRGEPVQMRTRMDLPIFRFSAKDCQPALQARWEPASKQIRVENSGTAHVLIQKLRLRYEGGEMPVAIPSLGYVLPGGSRTFTVPADNNLVGANWLDLIAQTSDATYTLVIKSRP